MRKFVLKAVLVLAVEEAARLMVTPLYGWIWFGILLYVGAEVVAWQRHNIWPWLANGALLRKICGGVALLVYVVFAGASALVLHRAANAPGRIAATKQDIADLQKRIESQRRNRPYINPTLIVDSLTPNDERFHIRIVNIGDADLKNPRIGISMDSMAKVDLLPLQTRDLVPGGHLDVPGPLFSNFVASRSVSLVVAYDYDSDDGIVTYTGRFSFLIPEGDLLGKEFAPIAIVPPTPGDSLRNNSTKELLDLLGGPVGTINLVLLERLSDGKVNVVSARSGDKFFEFDPDRRYAIFGSTRTGNPLVVTFDSGQAHFVSITWDEKGPKNLTIGGRSSNRN